MSPVIKLDFKLSPAPLKRIVPSPGLRRARRLLRRGNSQITTSRIDRRKEKKARHRQRKHAILKKVSATSSSSDSEAEDDYLSDHDDHNNVTNDKELDTKKDYTQKLNEMIETKSTTFNMEREYRRLEYLCAFYAGASRRLNNVLRKFGALLWLTCLVAHFAFDTNEAFKVYGYTFLAAQGIWMSNFIVGTLAMRYRVLPWLLEGLRELRRDECYEKTITNVLATMRRTPYIVLAFGLFGASAQHIFFYVDNAFNMSYGTLQSSTLTNVVLHVVRFLTATYVYAAYMLFWLGPTILMLMCGYSMAEFLDQFDAKIRDTSRITTFKEAISLYSQRAKFVKISSSKCLALLSMQLFSVIVCFALNTYVFLFSPTRRYLHVWHSIVPLLVMIYPLCTAAWVTKQYTWFIIVVVRAWVHRDDLDSSSSDDDSGIEEMKTSHDKKMFQSKAPFFSKKKLDESLNSSGVTGLFKSARPKSAHVETGGESKHRKNSIKRSSSTNMQQNERKKNSLVPWQKAAAAKQLSDPTINSSTTSLGSLGSRLASTVAAATAINKFRRARNKPRFNFEKFLSYLESMRSVVGFSIAGIMVTWDLVSTTLFLLFSIIAVFMQESIFGSQKSTL